MKAETVPSTIEESRKLIELIGFDGFLVFVVIFVILSFCGVMIWAIKEMGKKDIEIVIRKQQAEECEKRYDNLEREFKSITETLKAKLERAEQQIIELYDRLVT